MIALSPFQYRPGTFTPLNDGKSQMKVITDALRTNKLTLDDLVLLELMSQFRFISIHNLDKLIHSMESPKYDVVKKMDLKKRMRRYRHYNVILAYDFVPTQLPNQTHYRRVPRLYRLSKATYAYFMKHRDKKHLKRQYEAYFAPFDGQDIFTYLGYLQFEVNTRLYLDPDSNEEHFCLLADEYPWQATFKYNKQKYLVRTVRRFPDSLVTLNNVLESCSHEDNRILLICEDALHIEEIFHSLCLENLQNNVLYVTDNALATCPLYRRLTVCNFEEYGTITRSYLDCKITD